MIHNCFWLESEIGYIVVVAQGTRHSIDSQKLKTRNSCELSIEIRDFKFSLSIELRVPAATTTIYHSDSLKNVLFN